MKGFILLIGLAVVVSCILAMPAQALTDDEAVLRSINFIKTHSMPVHNGVMVQNYNIDPLYISRYESKVIVLLEVYTKSFGVKRSREINIAIGNEGNIMSVTMLNPKRQQEFMF
jgi:hypothetical protein